VPGREYQNRKQDLQLLQELKIFDGVHLPDYLIVLITYSITFFAG